MYRAQAPKHSQADTDNGVEARLARMQDALEERRADAMYQRLDDASHSQLTRNRHYPRSAPADHASRNTRTRQTSTTDRHASSAQSRGQQFDVFEFIGWMWRARLLILTCAIFGGVAGIAVPKILPHRYASYVDFVIDPAQNITLPAENAVGNRSESSHLVEVDSKLRVLTSTNVITRVVDALSLYDNPDFTRGNTGGTPAAARDAAVRALYEQVSTMREDNTFVATLKVMSPEPQQSVDIANAMMLAFEQELRAGQRKASETTGEALVVRLAELRARVSSTEEAVENFRRDRGLQIGEGELISSQSLGQLNGQINDARAALVEAKSKHKELLAARANGISNNVIDQNNETLIQLRADVLEVERESSSLAANFGPRHPDVVALKPQLNAVHSALNAEINRMIQAAATDRERAQNVLNQLSARLNDARALVSLDDTAMVQLRELQREAEVGSAVYEAYLRRVAELNERSQVDVTTIRVISPPMPAVSRSFPPRTLILAILGVAGGLMLGGCLAIVWGLSKQHLPEVRRRLSVA